MSIENTLERIATALETLALNSGMVVVNPGVVAPEQVQAPAATTKPRATKPKPTPAETPAAAVTPLDPNPVAADAPIPTEAQETARLHAAMIDTPKVVEPPAGFSIDDVRVAGRAFAGVSDHDGIMSVFAALGGIKTLDAIKPAQFAHAIRLFHEGTAAAQAKRAAAATADDALPF